MAPLVSLSPVKPEHAPAVQRLVEGDRSILEQTRLPDPYPKGGAASWIEYAGPRHERREEYSFVVLDVHGEVVGACGLVVSPDGLGAELGYWVGRPYRGRGYATEAVRKALEFAFGAARLERVFALPLVSNRPSRRVLEKAGMRLVGVQPAEARWAGEEQAAYELIAPGGP